MALSKQQIDRLNKIIATARKLIDSAEAEGSNGTTGKTRTRRSSADAEKMKAQIRAARAKGVPATKLAEKCGVSTAYIYMIK
jgi:transposase